MNFLEDFIDDSENLFHKYRSLVGSFRGKYYEKIFALPIENPCLNRLAFNIAGKEKIICGENEGEASDGSWYQRYFYRHAYNVRVQDAMGTMELKRYAGLIGKYGGNKVPARISHMSLGKENEKERKALEKEKAKMAKKDAKLIEKNEKREEKLAKKANQNK